MALAGLTPLPSDISSPTLFFFVAHAVVIQTGGLTIEFTGTLPSSVPIEGTEATALTVC